MNTREAGRRRGQHRGVRNQESAEPSGDFRGSDPRQPRSAAVRPPKTSPARGRQVAPARSRFRRTTGRPAEGPTSAGRRDVSAPPAAATREPSGSAPRCPPWTSYEREAGERGSRGRRGGVHHQNLGEPPAYVLVAETTRSTRAARPDTSRGSGHDRHRQPAGQETARLVPAAEIVASGPVPHRERHLSPGRRRRQEPSVAGAATCPPDPADPAVPVPATGFLGQRQQPSGPAETVVVSVVIASPAPARPVRGLRERR